MKILILTIATNKYIQFVDRLYDNIKENFLNGYELQGLLFTEHDVETSDNIKVSKIDHEDWPMPTLKRYNYFVKEKNYISQFDYCYYFDVDMGIVDKVGDEIFSDLVATMHPLQTFQPKEQRSYDRNPKSLAYVPVGKEGENYYAGGFNGGSTKRFLEMAEVLADRVTKDLENDVIALWHDESQMNRYLIDNPPTLTLTPSYCFAEEQMQNPDYPWKAKIIALKKDHNELRTKKMMKLDLTEIPAIYLNLQQDIEKNDNMQKILNECGFKKIIRLEGVSRPDNPIAGCSASHLKGLSNMKPPFILFEDDCQIKNFRSVIEVPSDADAVYLGVSSWGRMNGHSGPYVQYEKINDDLYRTYNMLSGHSILYLTEEYVSMCKRVCEHAAYKIEGYQDIGFAEIQRWFNVYTFDQPFFYQTSGYHGTVNSLKSYPTEECFSYNKNYYLPERIL